MSLLILLSMLALPPSAARAQDTPAAPPAEIKAESAAPEPPLPLGAASETPARDYASRSTSTLAPWVRS